jgi:hypothetical protein
MFGYLVVCSKLTTLCGMLHGRGTFPRRSDYVTKGLAVLRVWCGVGSGLPSYILYLILQKSHILYVLTARR